MKKLSLLLAVSVCLTVCTDKKLTGDYPVIDVTGKIGEYQKVYCSDLFSSIELIPLETKDECLLAVPNLRPSILLNDEIIVVPYTFFWDFRIYAFDRTGKFLNQIGQKGQGPGDYYLPANIFFDTEKPIVYVQNGNLNILAYELNGNFIRSIPIPNVEGIIPYRISYAGDNLFVGHLSNQGKNKFNYVLFDEEGDTVKCFPNHIFFNRKGGYNSYDGALEPFRVDERMYLKDYVNDTIYCLANSTLQPSFIFSLGKYSFPKEFLETMDIPSLQERALIIRFLIGTHKYFFYEISFPKFLPRPKVKPVFSPPLNQFITRDETVYGIYNIEEKKNILLDTNEHLETGIINDINGGLSFFPRYYAGNNEVMDIWDAAKMKETLTEEYFATKTIKDQKAHQQLKDLLEILQEDDNPVVVIAKLK